MVDWIIVLVWRLSTNQKIKLLTENMEIHSQNWASSKIFYWACNFNIFLVLTHLFKNWNLDDCSSTIGHFLSSNMKINISMSSVHQFMMIVTSNLDDFWPQFDWTSSNTLPKLNTCQNVYEIIDHRFALSNNYCVHTSNDKIVSVVKCVEVFICICLFIHLVCFP